MLARISKSRTILAIRTISTSVGTASEWLLKPERLAPNSTLTPMPAPTAKVKLTPFLLATLSLAWSIKQTPTLLLQSMLNRSLCYRTFIHLPKLAAASSLTTGKLFMQQAAIKSRIHSSWQTAVLTLNSTQAMCGC